MNNHSVVLYRAASKVVIALYFQFVFSSFWSIYAVDRELVYPKVIDAIIPRWMNHAMVSYTQTFFNCIQTCNINI